MLTNLGKAERREHVMTALRLVGLADRADHLPKQLSGGQEQRVGIARAIATDPALILADESTGDLDGESAASVLEVLEVLSERAGKTIVMVTHDPNAAACAHTVRHLEKGRLVADGSPQLAFAATGA